jgi:phosphate uptake regulator
MKRKLIKQGKGGYTIYLPKPWIDEKGLKGGEDIEITNFDGALLIDSERRSKKSITFNFDEVSRKHIRNVLTHTYRRGYETIRLSNINPEDYPKLHTLVDSLLIGFEVVDKQQSSCILENISEPSGEKYESLIRRLFYSLQEMIRILREDSILSSFENLTEIKRLRNQCDKYALFCRRLLVKERKRSDIVIEWELLMYFTLLSHNFDHTYTYLTKNTVLVSKEVNTIIQKLDIYFASYMETFYSKNVEDVYGIIHKKDELHFGKILTALEKEKNKHLKVVISYLREQFRLIQMGTSPLIYQSFEN